MVEEKQSAKAEDAGKIDLTSLLSTVLKFLGRTWWLCLVLVVLLGAFGYVRSVRSYTPKYTATASFLVNTGSATDSISTSRYYSRITTQQLNATFPFILTSGILNRAVAEDLGMSYIPGSISASMIGDINIFQIQVTADDGQTAYDILNSVVKNYPIVARYIIGNTELKPLQESGVPTQPSNPLKPWSSAGKWACLGIGIYLILLFLLALSQHTIRDKNDLSKYLNTKYLGAIPQVRFKRRSTKTQSAILLDNPNLPGGYFSAIETLQLRLTRILKENNWKTILVTSALMGEGKTTTTCNLSMLLAEKGARVLLIDGDLRNPSVAKCLRQPGLDKAPGLHQYLAGEDDVTSLIRQYRSTSLFVMPAGASVTEVSPLYTNGHLEILLNRLRDEFDYIIVDTPPCTFMHDTALIAPYFDTGIIVIRQDYAHVSKIMSCAEILAQADLSLAGCVINADASGGSSYGYGGYGKYGYGKYGTYRK